MRVGYIAKHDSGGNEDENAITYALEQLGHRVERLRESRGYVGHRLECDFVLFHHWHDPETLRRIKVPKVFWQFDLVTYPDPTLSQRNQRRIQWMNDIIPLVDLGFCTDGDWVKQDQSGKLNWLMQGCDSRFAVPGKASSVIVPLLFTGMSKGGGLGRESFAEEMRHRYRSQFSQIRGVHGEALADVIASSDIVLAPDHPATDTYWSNRVFLTLGFQGFLLHPYCERLKDFYEDGKELVMYKSRSELYELIDHYLKSPSERQKIREAGYARTIAEHTYTHRVEKLIQVVKERLF